MSAFATIRNRRDAAVWRCVRGLFDEGADPREAIEQMLLAWQDAAADAWLSGEVERELALAEPGTPEPLPPELAALYWEARLAEVAFANAREALER